MTEKYKKEIQGIATISASENAPNYVEPGNFEDAIKATGYGKFNFILLCVIIPGAFSQIIEQTGLSYVIPIAQCDLNLSLEQKGVVVSISYTGMIVSAFIWGYISDTYGRRKVIIFGFIGNSLCFLLSSLAQSYTMLLVTKFFSGFVFTGPFTAFISYLSEFHSTQNRSRIQLLRGLSTGIAVTILPLIAWAILPHIYGISILGLTLHSWNFFLAACGLPALTTGIIFIFMPESPRFLMASGKSTDALDIFKKVYNKNTGRRPSSFPIKTLKEEKAQKVSNESAVETKPSAREKIISGLTNIKPLFKRPYLFRVIHVSLTGIANSFGAFPVKLWYPQILQAINDNPDNSELHICNIVSSLAAQNSSAGSVCTVNLDNSSVYINASIQGTVQLLAFLLAGILVNKTGKKVLAVGLSASAACCPIIIYLVSNGTVMMALFPIIIAFAQVSSNILLTITMELFPTTFRSTATNLNMTMIRIGIFSGNVTMPYLLKTGCLSTLSFISVAIFLTSALTSLLPNTDNKDLE